MNVPSVSLLVVSGAPTGPELVFLLLMIVASVAGFKLSQEARKHTNQ